MQDKGLIGQDNCGSVIKMYHKSSNATMAVKRIRSTVDEREKQKQLLVDLDVVKRSSHCPYIIKNFLVHYSSKGVVMELMDTSSDIFYKKLIVDCV